MEIYEHEYTNEDGEIVQHKDSGQFFGSSYISAPNGTRTPVSIVPNLTELFEKNYYLTVSLLILKLSANQERRTPPPRPRGPGERFIHTTWGHKKNVTRHKTIKPLKLVYEMCYYLVLQHLFGVLGAISRGKPSDQGWGFPILFINVTSTFLSTAKPIGVFCT